MSIQLSTDDPNAPGQAKFLLVGLPVRTIRLPQALGSRPRLKQRGAPALPGPQSTWPLTSGSWHLAFRLWPLASGFCPLASGLWPLAFGLWPLASPVWLVVSIIFGL